MISQLQRSRSLECLRRRSADRPIRAGHPYLVTSPRTPLIAGALPRVDWSDAFALRTATTAVRRDPQEWADAIFHRPPPWIWGLFAVREFVVRAAGIEPGTRRAFGTVSRTADEVLLGVDQGHLSFRCSVLVDRDLVVVTTLVQLHNRRGAAYFAAVRKIHPFVVRSMLRRAALSMAHVSP